MAFRLLTVLAVLASLAGGILIVAQIDPPAPLDPVAGVLKRLDMELLVLVAGTAVPLALIVLAYIFSLRGKATRRPAVSLYLLGFSAGWIVAAHAETLLEASVFFSPIAFAVVVVAVLAAAAVPRLIEIGIGRLCAASGNTLLNRERWQMASRMLGIAQRLLPSNERIACNQGLALYELGEAEQALETLVSAYRGGERDPRLVKTLADSVFELPEDLSGEVLNDVLKLDPNNAKFGRKLVELHLKDRRPAEALPVLEKFYNSDDLEDVCLLGRLNAEQGKVDRALSLARRAMELEGVPYRRALADLQILAMQAPENPEVPATLAALNEKIANLDEAASWYLQLLEIQEDNTEARWKLIRLYRELGRPDQAFPHYRKLLRQDPDSPEVALEYGQMLEDREEFDKALKIFQDCSTRHPDDHRFAYHTALCLFGLGQLGEAAEMVERARANAPPAERARFQALAARVHQARVKIELRAMREQAHSRGATLDQRLNYVECLLSYEEADEASRDLDLLIEQFPGQRGKIVSFLDGMVDKGRAPFVLLNMLAGIRLKDRDFDRCHVLYEMMAGQSLHPEEIMADGCRQILRVQPNHLPSLKSHGELLLKGGHHREAARVLGKILELSPPSRDELLPMLFEVYYQLGDSDRAVPYGEELLKRDAQNLSLFLRLRELMIKRDDHQGAIRVVERALEVSPDNRQLREMLDESRQRLREGRIDALKAQLDLSPDNAAVLRELGDHYLSFQRLNDAITAYQKAAQNAEGNLRNLCLVRLAFCLGHKLMFDLADETLREIVVNKRDPEHLEEIKHYMYEVGGLFEQDEQFGRALFAYKELFKIDAGYKDIVDKIELLSHLAR